MIINIGTKLNSNFLGNTAKNAWNQCNQTHYYQIWVSCLYTFFTNIQGSIISLLTFHIHYFRLIKRIFYLDLIYKAIIRDLNLTISPILLLAKFFLYLKLFYLSTSLLLKACSLMNIILNVVILLSFFKKILYNINNPRWLKKIIALTQVLAKYRYIAIRKEI